jgi:hypothetical protein
MVEGIVKGFAKFVLDRFVSENRLISVKFIKELDIDSA